MANQWDIKGDSYISGLGDHADDNTWNGPNCRRESAGLCICKGGGGNAF